MNNKIMTDEVISIVLELKSEGKTISEISNILGINKNTIWSGLNHNNIRLSPSKGNIHYFDNIDSYAKAYIVGFIAADGSLVKAHGKSIALTITIRYEDKAILEFIKSEIGNTHKIQEIIRPSSYNSNKIIHHARYCIVDKNIITALNNLGITSNKSLTMGNIITNIPYKYRDAFIIGYFDGDGSISIRDGEYLNGSGYMCKNYSMYISIRGTKEFLKGVCNHLNISESHIRLYDSIHTLSFASKKDTYRLFQCYENLPFYYIRKYEKFLQRINHKSYDKYKQVQTISSSTY